MILGCLLLSFIPPVRENSIPSQTEFTCKKVMGVILIIFGVISVCAFTACTAAAIALGSAPLAIGAGVVGLIGIGVLISSVALAKNNLEPPKKDPEVHVNIVHVNQDQNHRPSVPQYSLTKRPSSSAVKSRK